MLATKPAGTHAAHTLAAATTEIMWACAFAMARMAVASTAHSLELWSHMLYPPTGRPDQPAPLPASETAGKRQPSGAPAGAIPFARYRSSGGHAAAQVIVSE
jgi:hypothetical protein